MNVLVIGGGGREHTIVWKLAQSPKVKKLYAIPGGPGMMGLAECVPMDVTNLEGLAQWAETHAIDLTVVGPEAPLVAVSYTHLDVYKRQMVGSGSFLFGGA